MGDRGIFGLVGAVGALITILSLMFLYVKTLIGGITIVDFTTEAVQYVVPSPTEILIEVAIAFAVVLIGVVLGIVVVFKR